MSSRFVSSLLLCLFLATPLQAESIVAQGVAGDMDSHSRCPVLTVSTEVNGETAKILADAYMQDPAYNKYPLRFDFYINRKLFTSQFRSPELPGAVGVDIGSDVATVPFNYAVVVQMIHPNRSFSTVIQGAVYANNLSNTYSCTAAYVLDGETINFTNNDVDTLQMSENGFSLNFEGIANSTTLKVGGTVSLAADNSLSSDMSFNYDGSTATYAMTGTATILDNKITAFELNSAESGSSVSCTLK